MLLRRADRPGGAAHRTEHHRTDRIGWLRAAVLGANDGIVSTASPVLVTSVSDLIAGAMSMAAGEFVSVHPQKDPENADLTRELAGIYVKRGLRDDAQVVASANTSRGSRIASPAGNRRSPGRATSNAPRTIHAERLRCRGSVPNWVGDTPALRRVPGHDD